MPSDQRGGEGKAMVRDVAAKTNGHILTYRKGSDARNHTVVCCCGWCFASTYRAVRERGEVHVTIFVDEHRAWNDPKRQAEMPIFVQHNYRTPTAGSRSTAGPPAFRA